MYNVLITDPIDERGIELLEESGEIEVLYRPKASVEDYMDDLGSIHGWIVRSGTKISNEMLLQADNLRVIGRAGVGVDNIDLDGATLRGVIVMNTPTGNTNAAAEQTMTLMLAAARNVVPACGSLKQGRWDRSEFIGHELMGKTLGIIGLGRIGQLVAKRSKSFDMELIGFDPFLQDDQFDSLDVESVELEELFSRADIITAHVPLNEQTQNLIGDEEIDRMKEGVILVNCSRGGVYDEDAVVRGLDSGKIGAIGFDVFESEPLDENHPFLQYENAVVTPHLGASTIEAKENVARDICNQVRDFLLEDKVRNAVNIPFADFSRLKQMDPYLDLAQRLGLLQVSLAEGPISEVRLRVSGDFDEIKPLTLATLKGVLSPVSGEKVNLLNATLLAKQRGIKVEESYEYEDSGYSHLLEVIVKSEGRTLRATGSLFGKLHPRVVQIDDYHMDAKPIGTVLMIRNNDVPGVIGNVGSFLGSRGINIAEYRLGRQENDGNIALAMVNLDSPVSDEDLEALEEEENILQVQQVTFPTR